jgi:signal transduction histidine kinase
MAEREKPHVLIVDDDATVRSFLSTALDTCGFRVTSASDGLEGLAAIDQDPPDVTLVDLRMPRLDGKSFAERVLKDDPSALIVVLTGHGTLENTVDLMRKGVYSVIAKPCSPEEIQFTVEKGLRERRLRERSRELEHRLEISERLAMIGKLAAGVAHELNSPLDGVIRFVKLTLETLEKGTDARDFQEEALSGLMRMSAIIKDLLTFSRNIALEIEEENLKTLLHDAERQTIANLTGKTVVIEYDVALPEISVPRGLFQVFQNLLKNAADAVDDGGRIEIRAGIRNGELYVAFRDDGPGIPAEIRDRVFEPFFTTKDVGKGTGLGLSIVSRIMERLEGGVDLESEEGVGSTVTVYLPTRANARDPNEEGEEVDAASFDTAR